MFSISFICKEYISLQAPCQIFIGRSGRLGWPVPCSLISDIQIHFIHLASYPALLLLILATVPGLDSSMCLGHSKCVIELNEFKHPDVWECGNVNVSISCQDPVRFSSIAREVWTIDYSFPCP
jgi:hypothetical protein